MKTIQERESRKWWAVVNGGVREVTGYSCAPHNPDMWWCPDVGLSMSSKHHLFQWKADAIQTALAENREAARKLEVQRVALEAMKGS